METKTTATLNDTRCLEVNSAYMPLKIISSKRAFVVWYKGNAEIIYEYPTYFRTVNQKFAKPSIIRIPRYVEVKYNKVPFSKANVFKRDRYSCVYCGDKTRGSLTIDHVVPRAHGGKDSWENLVTCCSQCNSEKADLTVEEWGRSHPAPFRPHSLLLMQKNLTYVPDEWKQFLFL